MSESYVGHNHPATSHAMAAKLPLKSKKSQILSILTNSANGQTDFEVEDITGWAHQTVSGSRRKLVQDGKVANSGATRVNRFGNNCIVWKAV